MEIGIQTHETASNIQPVSLQKQVLELMEPIEISIKFLAHFEGLPSPRSMSEGSAGIDLLAAVKEPRVLNPGERDLIPTGMAISIPDGFQGEVRPRSGLALNHGIGVLNSPGTIDSDYRGEVQVILINLGNQPFVIRRGDRIAQLIFASFQKVSFKVCAELDVTKRNTGGFGHTGI